MKTVVKFAHKKDTKGTEVYNEVTEDGSEKTFGTVIGQLYLKKEFLKGAKPATISVTIDF